MFEVFTHFSFLNCLSILAFITTVGLFFCGIPICRQIWKRRDTKEISGAPFLMGVVGGSCWFAYGYLKKDYTVLYVTGTQVILYATYTVFYWFMTKKKLWISLKVLAVIGVVAGLASSVYFFDHKVFHPLGFVCMTLNAMDFAAPLAGLKVVIRRRATSTLPLPLCIANFLVSSEWFVYGLLVKDFYLITPNGIGCFFATAQLIMFAVLPRKPGMYSPIVRLYRAISSCCGKPQAVESDITQVVSRDKELGGSKIDRATRWSKRVIANMAGEIETAITKVGLHDQFGYSGKLNRLDDENADVEAQAAAIQRGRSSAASIKSRRSTRKSTNEPREKVVVIDMEPEVVREEEKKARQISNQLRPQTSTGLRRHLSSPNLSDDKFQ